MTDEPTGTVETEEAPTVEMVHCRHCGAKHEAEVGDLNWECQSCGLQQDTMLCPTCHQVARISLMPAEAVPAAHAPASPRKSKED